MASLRRELNLLHEKEEVHWRQRSRIARFKEGDRNTSFYHACASQRKKTNTIVGLNDDNGIWHSDKVAIDTLAVDYFSNLFFTSHLAAVGEVVNHVEPAVTFAMNEGFLVPFTNEEVKFALFQMHPSKAPSPNGMTNLFYQKIWHIVEHDVCLAVLDFLNNGHMLKNVNSTHIALIPKVKNSESMSNFRPISLCDVIYKIISKILVNRMKLILPNVIADSQSAFVPGRMITDNVIITFESLHYLKNLRGGKNAQIVAKFDMSKAYD